MSDKELQDGMAPEEAISPAAATEKQAAKAEKKSPKPAKKEKSGFFARIARWLREMRSELKKVQWPSTKQTINNTVIVIICVLVVGVFIWAFDWLARLIIEALLNLFNKV